MPTREACGAGAPREIDGPERPREGRAPSAGCAAEITARRTRAHGVPRRVTTGLVAIGRRLALPRPCRRRGTSRSSWRHASVAEARLPSALRWMAGTRPVSPLTHAAMETNRYPLRGVSRPLWSGRAGAIGAMIGATAAAVPRGQAAAALVLLAVLTSGLVLVAAALRLRLPARLFPEPVRVGFLAGTGITVAVAQSAELLLNGPGSLAVGAASLALMLALRRLGLRASSAAVVLALAAVSSALFDLERLGARGIGSTLAAFIPAPLSGLWHGHTLATLLVSALSVAVLARLHCPSAGGVRPEAWRPAALALVLSLVLSDVLHRLPLATISALVVVVSLGWIDAGRLSELRQRSPRGFRMALVAAFGVTLLGPRWGVAIGVATALGEALRRARTARRERRHGRRRRAHRAVGARRSGLRAEARAPAPSIAPLSPATKRRRPRRGGRCHAARMLRDRLCGAQRRMDIRTARPNRRCCSPTPAGRGRARVR